MKLYAQFKRINQDLLGSDGYLPLDARKATHTVMHEAKQHARRLNANLNKGITGVEIRRGDFKSSFPIVYSDL